MGDRVKRLRATIQTLKAQDAERRAEAGSSGTADADRVTESFEDFQRTLDRAISEGRRNRQEALERNLESRGQQQEAIQNLVDASLGKVPSAAEIQQRFGLEQALSQQNALASRGVGSSALAGRQAALAGSRLQGQALAQGGALRAQEQAAARALLQRAISGQRGQDLQEAGMGTQLQVPSQGQLGSSISNLGQFFLGGQELELGRDKLAFQEEKFKQEMARAIENDEWGRVLEMIGIGTGFAQGLAGPAIAAGSRQKE
ncbi:MAG: hypothetical protein GWN58_58680 [Anaerolineae bacterium]|nr:hypothetical protein [Anaerolineae bacterium]